MKIELKRPIQLPAPDKRILRPGIHTIEDSLKAHWFIQGLISDGSIIVKGDTDKQTVLKPSGHSVKSSAKPLVLEVEAKPKPKVRADKSVKIPAQIPTEPEIVVEEVVAPEEVMKEPKTDDINVEEVVEETAEPVERKRRKEKEKKKKVKSLM